MNHLYRGVNKEFYEEFGKAHPLMMNKWFISQASFASNFERIKELRAHPDFSIENPNRLRSLSRGLVSNTKLFYTKEGIEMLGSLIKEVDAFGNGQVASGLARNWNSTAGAQPLATLLP